MRTGRGSRTADPRRPPAAAGPSGHVIAGWRLDAARRAVDGGPARPQADSAEVSGIVAAGPQRAEEADDTLQARAVRIELDDVDPLDERAAVGH